MKRLITSALPYVNNVPHLGNIIGCVLSADAYARFCRLRGYDTLFVCGTDEYGTATETRAREEGCSPREICDKYHAIHADIYRDFNISFDVFGRTSTPEQTRIAQDIFQDLEAAGFIIEKSSARTYCAACAMFLADRYVEGTCPHCGYEDARGDQCDQCGRLLEPEQLKSPRCKVCGSSPVLQETAHLYLALDALQERLQAWVQARQESGSWTRNAVQTTASWLEKGLQPRPITRDLTWGIPVPRKGYEKKVFYVWFDAPIGYISITAAARPDWREWWQNPDGVQLYQFMAKDNIPFHTVIFPASLIGTGRPWTMLHHINSTEYLNYEDTKFSKSRNVGVFGDDVKRTGIPVDLWRFYLLSNRPERNDTAFTWQDFFEKTNAEFIDNIGNLVNRTLVYLTNNFDGLIRDFPRDDTQREFAQGCREDCAAVTQALEEVRLRDALRRLLALGNRANKFFQDMQPWEIIKTDRNHAHATVSLLAYAVRSLAIALEPFMPETARRMLAMLAVADHDWSRVGLFEGLDGHRIARPEIIYHKLNMADAEKFRKKFSGAQADFSRLAIRAARIVQADPHPEAQHLYCLQLECGAADTRSVAAGLVKHYSADELIGRSVLLLANLKPVDVRGVLSRGMVLVCEKRNKLELLDAGAAVPGTPVEVDGQAGRDAEISLEVFKAAPLRIVDGRMMFDDLACTLEGRPICTRVLKNGPVR